MQGLTLEGDGAFCIRATGFELTQPDEIERCLAPSLLARLAARIHAALAGEGLAKVGEEPVQRGDLGVQTVAPISMSLHMHEE